MLTERQLKNTPFTCSISNEEYHNSPGISASGTSLLLDCPLKYWDKYLNPDKPPHETTPSMRFGTMVHCFLMENEEFPNRYFTSPKVVRRGTKEWDGLETTAGRREIIFPNELDILCKIHKAVQEHPIAKYLFQNGHAEHSIFFKNKETGILCKSRPDYLTPDYIVDVKTTKCASLLDFERSVANYGYHRQAAIALDAKEAISGIKQKNFINLCIETERPYVISVFSMSNDAIERGRREYVRALEIFNECSEKNYWPQYVEKIEEISLPGWRKFN